ncbi:Uncharacterised protein [Candidatus Bilamarchaeum dharawalense]|uniref:Uncharacterized protein n=1 Tax=Candidatus Bilamarchaeum dharawalense TaxID=2885759 RepID=A0A5E4LVJ8_9ARCH|nr:Uncharacterised protein [Candidatus Bilamarchaeum dharawalense]
MDLKRSIRCTNCGNESNIQISSDLDMKELLIAGKCSKCGSALQINYSLVDTSASQTNPLNHLSTQSTEDSSNSIPDLDESLFGSTSSDSSDNDMLRDLMED